MIKGIYTSASGMIPRVEKQEIITDQQSEIQLMQLWLKQHSTRKLKRRSQD